MSAVSDSPMSDSPAPSPKELKEMALEWASGALMDALEAHEDWAHRLVEEAPSGADLLEWNGECDKDPYEPHPAHDVERGRCRGVICSIAEEHKYLEQVGWGLKGLAP